MANRHCKLNDGNILVFLLTLNQGSFWLNQTLAAGYLFIEFMILPVIKFQVNVSILPIIPITYGTGIVYFISMFCIPVPVLYSDANEMPQR